MTVPRTADLVDAAQRFSAGSPGGVLIIGCGALAREILALIAANDLAHVTLTCLPALLHNDPPKITQEVRATIRANRDIYDTILVAYGDCGTGGHLDAMLAHEGVERIDGAHCYAFYAGIEDFNASAETEIDAFYLTDFLARQFDAIVYRPLGLDRHPELRDTYFGNYRKLVYLAQTDNDDLDARARRAAALIGLAYERRFTGYGDLATFVGR
jgi:hypothetical protein